MIKRQLSPDIAKVIDASPSDIVKLLQEFNPGDFYEEPFSIEREESIRDTSRMVQYVQALKRAGLDIGPGNAEWGYKMPTPVGKSQIRYLQIFRRR